MPTNEEKGWLTTMLTSVGGVLVAGLLMSIALSQSDIVTHQAVLSEKFDNQAATMDISNNAIQSEQKRLSDLMRKIFPRLRTHGENIVILHRQAEEQCSCKIKMQTPEEF